MLVRRSDGHIVPSILTTHRIIFDWSKVSASISGDIFVPDNTVKHGIFSNLYAVSLKYAIKYNVLWNFVFMTKLENMQLL
jgi:hypothetical protein